MYSLLLKQLILEMTTTLEDPRFREYFVLTLLPLLAPILKSHQ